MKKMKKMTVLFVLFPSRSTNRKIQVSKIFTKCTQLCFDNPTMKMSALSFNRFLVEDPLGNRNHSWVVMVDGGGVGVGVGGIK